jgi:hypothetical protein
MVVFMRPFDMGNTIWLPVLKAQLAEAQAQKRSWEAAMFPVRSLGQPGQKAGPGL